MPGSGGLLQRVLARLRHIGRILAGHRDPLGPIDLALALDRRTLLHDLLLRYHLLLPRDTQALRPGGDAQLLGRHLALPGKALPLGLRGDPLLLGADLVGMLLAHLRRLGHGRGITLLDLLGLLRSALLPGHHIALLAQDQIVRLGLRIARCLLLPRLQSALLLGYLLLGLLLLSLLSLGLLLLGKLLVLLLPDLRLLARIIAVPVPVSALLLVIHRR